MTTPARTITRFKLALAAALITNASLFAQEQAPGAREAVSPAPASKKVRAFDDAKLPVTDIALAEDGSVRGRVLTADGKPIDGAQVVIRRDTELLHKLISDEKGQFSAKGLQAGVYTIATVQGGGLYRLWPKNIAPPSAKPQALLMTTEPVVRGQFGGATFVDWASIGIGAAGLTFGILNYTKLQDLEDDVNSLKSP